MNTDKQKHVNFNSSPIGKRLVHEESVRMVKTLSDDELVDVIQDVMEYSPSYRESAKSELSRRRNNK